MPGRLASAEITDPAVIAAKVTPAVAETARRQVEVAIDCIGDGEFWTARSLAHDTMHFTGIEAHPVDPGEPPTTGIRPENDGLHFLTAPLLEPDGEIPTYQAYGTTIALTEADIAKLPEANRRRVLTFRRIAEIAERA